MPRRIIFNTNLAGLRRDALGGSHLFTFSIVEIGKHYS